MKYNVIISRTYATELVVDANDKEGVYEWVGDNEETINHQELEQCNIINADIDIELVIPSLNEAEELLDLAYHIHRLLQNYSHVADFVPKEIRDALEKMSSHIANIED
jgi:hypothetical protein